MTSSTTRKTNILVIDDDLFLGETLCDALSGDTIEVVCAATGAEGVAICKKQVVDIVLLDQKLPDGTGADFCEPILEHNEHTKIVFMTAFPNFENAVAALKAGACDYLSKPFEIEELQLTIGNAVRLLELESIERLHGRRRQEEAEGAIVVGACEGFRAAVDLARRATAAGAPILITGETGTGKTLVAKHLHYSGRNAAAPFISLNCAALPESLAESELFGHEKGAFTGAEGVRRGVFEMAEDGTVLLDEIGSMALPLQAKLLGVLEERQVRRLGGEKSRPVTAQVIAATNKNIEAAVADGSFRSDLYYRLGVVPITIPPLRDRKADLPELCFYLTRSICGRSLDLGAEEIARLAAYSWPGNVRELKNVIERALIVQGENEFRPSQFLGGLVSSDKPSSPQGGAKTLEEIENEHIERVLAENSGNLTRTARELGIALSTLKRKIKR